MFSISPGLAHNPNAEYSSQHDQDCQDPKHNSSEFAVTRQRSYFTVSEENYQTHDHSCSGGHGSISPVAKLTVRKMAEPGSPALADEKEPGPESPTLAVPAACAAASADELR